MPKPIHGTVDVNCPLEGRRLPWIAAAHQPRPVRVVLRADRFERGHPLPTFFSLQLGSSEVGLPLVPVSLFDELGALISIEFVDVGLSWNHAIVSLGNCGCTIDTERQWDLNRLDFSSREIEEFSRNCYERVGKSDGAGEMWDISGDVMGLSIKRPEPVWSDERIGEVLLQLWRQRKIEVVIWRMERGVSCGNEDVRT